MNYTILTCICKFSLQRKPTIVPGKCFLLHLHAKFLFSFEYVLSDSTPKLILLCFFKFLIYTSFLNKKQDFFRPAPVSHKRGYYFKDQGLVFL